MGELFYTGFCIYLYILVSKTIYIWFLCHIYVHIQMYLILIQIWKWISFNFRNSSFAHHSLTSVSSCLSPHCEVNIVKPITITIFCQSCDLRESRIQKSWLAGGRHCKRGAIDQKCPVRASCSPPQPDAQLQSCRNLGIQKKKFPHLHIIQIFQIAGFQHSIFFPLWRRHATNVQL